MNHRFRPDSDQPAWLVWRQPAGASRLPASRALLLGGAGVALALLAVQTWQGAQGYGDLGLGRVGAIVLLALASVLGALGLYYAREARGRSAAFIVLRPRELELDLPAHRSLVHRTPRVRATLPLSDIECLETRVELYRLVGVPVEQRVYRLRRKSAEDIVLFEERPSMTDSRESFTRLVATIAQRAKVQVRDLGGVKGRSGFLGLIGARPPAWSTPSLWSIEEEDWSKDHR